MKSAVPFLIICSIWFSSCGVDEQLVEEETVYPALMEIPEGFPSVPEPEDNTFTQIRWELGKKLFFDKRLSSDGTISCASCHEPSLAFSDDVSFSSGVQNRAGTRNSPSLTNVAYHPYYTREGGLPSLETQVAVPIQEHNEFDNNIVALAAMLKEDPSYADMAVEAYGREMNPFVITRALSCFERSLISGHSPYDAFLNGEEEQMTVSALRGMDLFFSEQLNCSVCHAGFNLTDYRFANNGLYESYPDEGRYRLTQELTDLATFKTPSLRNIEYTAPYMHDGSISSLDQVIEHYATGGAEHPNKSPLINGFEISDQDKKDLKAFLLSLSDEQFINNPLFKSP